MFIAGLSELPTELEYALPHKTQLKVLAHEERFSSQYQITYQYVKTEII